MQMLSTATKLDWGGWLRGVIGALVSGGAGAVSAGFAVNMLDKAHDINLFKAMALTFAGSGIVSLAKYLQITPTPEPEKPVSQP